MADPFKDIRSLLHKGDFEKARVRLKDSSDKWGDAPFFKAIYGYALLRCGEMEKGKKLIEESALVTPENPFWAADLALALFLIGEPQKAKEIVCLAVSFPDAIDSAFNLLGAIKLGEGDLEGAEREFNQALLRNPARAEILNNLGGIAVRQGKLDEALSYYERALVINRDLPQSVGGRNAMLVALERVDEAVLDLEERVQKEPDSIPLRIHLAHLLDDAGRFDEACLTLREAFDLDKKNIEVLLQFAVIVSERSLFRAALWALLKAEELEPENHIVLSMLAKSYIEVGAFKKAAEKIDYLMELFPDAPANLMIRASLRSAQDDFQGAEDDLYRVLEILPGSAEALGSLGHTLMLNGRISEAVECFEKAALINPASLANLIEARAFPEDPETIEKMAGFVKNPLVAKVPRASMGFALTKVFEKQGEFDRAFQYAKQANELTRKAISYDPDSYSKLASAIEAVFSRELINKFKDTGVQSERPVFVVGMPRSGTTLTEQILCSHQDIFGAGELGYIPSITKLMPRVLQKKVLYPGCMKLFKKWMVRHAAAYYLKNIKKMDSKAVRVVDKLPHNFLHLGLISLIFPNAKIIHVKRDFRDVAISNYFTNFKHKHGGMGYAFSLTDIGKMINDYRRIMDHWRMVLPGNFFEFNYEDLVEDQEQKGRELIEFIGLEWDPNILEFYTTKRPVKTASVWQVRQPIYTSSKERWRQYEDFLEPLMKVLGEYSESRDKKEIASSLWTG